MEETWKKLREYASRIRKAFFEIDRDPYMALVEGSFIRRSLFREEDMSKTSKMRLERDLRELEKQATYDWERKGY
ncbi:MAG: hypothetical protein ACP5N7_02610 [Candidatus Pacearchaeota archaeon]